MTAHKPPHTPAGEHVAPSSSSAPFPEYDAITEGEFIANAQRLLPHVGLARSDLKRVWKWLAKRKMLPLPTGALCLADPPASTGLPPFVRCLKRTSHNGRHWYAIEWAEPDAAKSGRGTAIHDGDPQTREHYATCHMPHCVEQRDRLGIVTRPGNSEAGDRA